MNATAITGSGPRTQGRGTPSLPARLALALSTAVLLAAAPPRPAADDGLPQPLVAAIAPGPAKDAASRLLLRPYADATGTVLGLPAWDGSADGLKPILAGHAVDLILLPARLLALPCRDGLLQKLDWTAFGRDRFLPGTTSDCGAGAAMGATVLAWDRGKLPGTPGWADFWDVAKYPGRRGLHRGARGNLELALLADGVAAGDVFRTLRSVDGVDRAFRKLDQIKPYAVWWDAPAQPAQLLAGAKVLLTSAPADQLPHGPVTHVGVQWDAALLEVTVWALAASPAHPRAAQAALAAATDPVRNVAFARATFLGPAVKAAVALLPDAARADSPALPAHLQAALPEDESFWADSGERLEARFAAWLAR